MIFVTVGSTRFDALVREVDRLVESGTVRDDVVCQIGTGEYEPTHCTFFRFKPSITEDLDAADLIITHGGNTVFEAIARAKPLIVVANTDLADDHQTKMLEALAEQIPVMWTRVAGEIGGLIAKLDMDKGRAATWQIESLAADINDYLEEL